MWPFGYGNKYPYSNFHELNADWILDKIHQFGGSIASLEKKMADFFKDTAPIIVDAVNQWLDDHPEATTTVEDGSITIQKLAADIKRRIVDNIAVKFPIYGRGNPASGTITSNDPEVSAPIAFTDAVLNTNVFRTRRDDIGFTGDFQNVLDVTASTVTITDDLDSFLKVGMYICLYDELPNINDNYLYYGMITSWNENVITVNNWYNRNDTQVTPTGILYAVVNPKFKFYNNFYALHLKNINIPSGAQWTREMIGNQTELYTDVAGVVYGYDTVLRQNENNARSYAFRARNDTNTQWSRVFHVEGNVYGLLSHDNTIMINGTNAWCVPYVKQIGVSEIWDNNEPNAAPVLLTNGENVPLDDVIDSFTASASMMLLNNSGDYITINTINQNIRFGGSNHTIKTFRMKPYELLHIFKPLGSEYIWIHGTEEFTPGDTLTIPDSWYPIACNDASNNFVVIPLPKNVRACSGATLTGRATLRQSGTTIASLSSLSDTSIWSKCEVTITEFGNYARINLGVVNSSNFNNNMCGNLYLTDCVITFN